jgi:MFS family permease
MSSGSLLAERDFRLLLAGQTTSQLGAQLSSVALPLVAILTLGATAFEVGLINAAGTLAFAVIGLPAGAWLDRWPRWPILIISDLVRAVLLATIPLAAVFDLVSIGQLIMVSLLVGAARVFFDIGYRSYLPSVIGKDRVLTGNASLEFIRASGQVVGPGLGGLLVTVISAAWVIGIQAVTFVVSAITILTIRTRERVVVDAHHRVRLRSQVSAGLQYVWRHRVLRATAVAGAVSNTAFAAAGSVSFIFMNRTLLMSPMRIGLTVAIGSIAVMIGAALTPRIARRVGSARLVWLSLAVTTPPALAGAFARPGWATVLIVFAIAAGELGQISYAITNVSLRQRICPDHLLGRVNATMTVLIMGLLPVGALAGGVLGGLIGPRGTLLVVGGLLVSAPVILYRGLRGVREVEELCRGDEL